MFLQIPRFVISPTCFQLSTVARYTYPRTANFSKKQLMNLCFPKPKMCRAPVEKVQTATITNRINNNIDLQQTDFFFLFKKQMEK